MTATFITGDCIEELKKLPDNSVDSIVTDPPYGIEFMGREWDSFAPSAPKTSTERADHMNKSTSFGPWGRRERPIAPNDYGHRNERCLECGKWRISSNRCECAEPKWEYRIRESASASMLAFQEFSKTWAAECLRVLKPGGHLLAFGGTRTYHRLACAIEDAGFEIRDQMQWLYGSGFPKAGDISKAIDKAAGVDREDKYGGTFDRFAGPTGNKRCEKCGKWLVSGSPCQCPRPQDEPVTEDAKKWKGWAGLLKPAHEPVVVARKPLAGTVIENVLTFGTGALNIDGCRIAVADADYAKNCSGDRGHDDNRKRDLEFKMACGKASDIGRFPSNVILDPEAAEQLDEQSGDVGAAAPVRGDEPSSPTKNTYNKKNRVPGAFHNDSGGASRFFYCAKASKKERDAGLDGKNPHPTVKPMMLMRYLVRLVTPPGGVVLDPFVGSGTTACACELEGFDSICMDTNPEYIDISQRRYAFWRTVAEQAA